jgi:hypothetical protein
MPQTTLRILRGRSGQSSAAVATSREGHRSLGSSREVQHRRWGRKQRYTFQKKPIFSVSWVLGSWVLGVRMNIDDSRLIVRFQRLITEMLVEKRLGQRRPELTDELHQTWREVEQGGLKETPEYRDVLLRADRHALWLAGLVQLAASPVSSPETERIDTLDAPQKAA